jgi:O-antigen ligase
VSLMDPVEMNFVHAQSAYSTALPARQGVLRRVSAALSQRPDAASAVLFGIVIISGFIDSVRAIPSGGISGGGLVTLAGCGAAWCVWLTRPTLPSYLAKVLLPLIMFEVYALGSLMWYLPGVSGLQQLSVYLSFLGFILLAAREAEARPAMAAQLHGGILAGSAIAVALYLVVCGRGGLGAEGLVGARSYGLYALTPLAVAVAWWRAGRWNALAWAAVLMIVLLLSMSRTAMVMGLLLFPLAVALRGTWRSVMAAGVMLAGGAAAFVAVVMSYPPLYNRFFAEDASMKVGGVTVNASGRTRIWNLLLDSLGRDWVFGRGLASSANFVADHFKSIAQPHNDFLRFYYDFGLLGLMLWIAFLVGVGTTVGKNLRRSLRGYDAAGYPLHLAAILALVAVSGSMFTDNSVTDSFVMVPLAIVIGLSLGAGRRRMQNDEG